MAFWGVAAALNVIMIGATLQTPLYTLYQRWFGFNEIVLTMIYAMYMAGTLVAYIVFGVVIAVLAAGVIIIGVRYR